MRTWTARRRALSDRVSLGRDDRIQVAARRAASMRLVGGAGGAGASARRVEAAPPGYLLAHGSSDIARHCELLTPLPSLREVRVVATPGRASGWWHLDVASRDRPGLLAAFTGVLALRGIDVVQAVLATWEDGGALQAFLVRSRDSPDSPVGSGVPASPALHVALEASLAEPLSSPPVAGAQVTFDDRASPLYTRCDVRAEDRPGLLHAVAVAIAAAGADIHAARVTTENDVAHDRFDLSDATGAKLGAALEDTIRANVRGGVIRGGVPRGARARRLLAARR